MSTFQNFVRFGAKCPGAKCPWGILSWGILSVGQNVLGAKCLLAQKIIQISPWPLRFLRSDPWDIGKLRVDGQGPSSFSVPRPLHTSLTSSSSSHYLSTFISPTLSSSPTLPSRHQTSVLMEKSIRHWFVTISLLWILCFLGLLRLLLGRSPQIFTAHKNWSQTQFPGK